MLELYKDGELVHEIEVAELSDQELAAEIDHNLSEGLADEFRITGFVL